MLSHAEAKPQSPLMLLRPRHAVLRTQGITWGTLQASLFMLFCLWFELRLSLPCNTFPLILFPEPWWFTSVLRGADEHGDRGFHLRGTIPFNTKCSVGKPHGSSFFLIKKLLIFCLLKKIQLAHGCIIRQRLEECIKQGIMGYVLKKKRPIFSPTKSGPHSLKYKLLNT